MHDIDSALRVIGARDTAAARLANGLWGAMRAGAAHPRVTRYDVQGVCWGALPLLARKPESAAIIGDRHQAARILGELLDLLDYPRYADICRGEVTREILDAAEDVDRCTELTTEAWRDSGVQPPNTTLLTWGEVRGPVEQAVHAATGRILEEAIEDGLVDLRARNVEPIREGLTLRILTSPAEELPGTWYAQIFDERLTTWLTFGGSQTRRELLVRIRPDVAKPPEFSTNYELPALEVLLEACADAGLRLTRNGYLPTSLVRDLVELTPACADYPPSGRSESAFPPLGNLRQLATELGLIKRIGNRLILTPAGHDRLSAPEQFVAAVGEALVARDSSLRGVIQEVVFAVLLLETTVDLDRLLDKVAVVVGEEGWGPGTPGLSTEDLCRDFGMLFLRRLHILDVLEVEDDGRRVGLTEAGVATARWALRARVMLREVTV